MFTSMPASLWPDTGHHACSECVSTPQCSVADEPGLISGTLAPSRENPCWEGPWFVMCTVTSAPYGTVTVLGLMNMSPSVKLRVTGLPETAAACWPLAPVALAAVAVVVLLDPNSFTPMSPATSPSASATLMVGIRLLNNEP